MYTFTNQFGGSELRQRIGMINQQRSGQRAWLRYVLWAGLSGLVALACRHGDDKDTVSGVVQRPGRVSATNATRSLVNALDARPSEWDQEGAMAERGERTIVIYGVTRQLFSFYDYPTILSLHDGKLRLYETDAQYVRVFINGRESTAQVLETTSFAAVNELFIYRNRTPQSNEQYRILLSTSHENRAYTSEKKKWKTFMEARAAGGNVYGDSHTFSMNQLLEATFFHDKRAFVERTKDDHLLLPDEYASSADLFINGLPASPEDIETVHIREVDKLYTRERPFEEWHTGTNPQKRYILYIETAPKRAKRDSSYYVFSPFYSGDF